MLDLVVANGTVVQADGRHAGWVGVAGESIVALGSGEVPAGRRVVDARGCLVLPGVVDAHVHGTWDDHLISHEEFFAAETRAAACGGVTTVVDYAEQLKGETLAERIAKRRAELRTACVDFAVHCAVTDVTAATLAEIPEVLAAGIPSFKVFTTYAGSKLEGKTVEGERMLELSFPANLFNAPLVRLFGSVFQAAFEHAHAKGCSLDAVEVTPVLGRYAVRWG